MAIEFDLKQIFKKSGLTNESPLNGIKQEFNSSLEENSSELESIFMEIISNHSESGIDFGTSPVYYQFYQQTNLDTANSTEYGIPASQRPNQVLLFDVDSRAKLNQIFAKRKNPQFSMRKVDSTESYQVTFDYPNNDVVVFNDHLCVYLNYQRAAEIANPYNPSYQASVPAEAIALANQILFLNEDSSIEVSKSYEMAMSDHKNGDIKLFYTQQANSSVLDIFSIKNTIAASLNFTDAGIEFKSSSYESEKATSGKPRSTKEIASSKTKEVTWNDDELNTIGVSDPKFLSCSIINLKDDKKSKDKGRPNNINSNLNENTLANSAINLMFGALFKEWLNKDVLSKLFNGKFIFTLQDMQHSNGHWQFSISMFLGTVDKTQSEQLISLIYSFVKLNPNFQTSMNNNVLHVESKSTGIRNTNAAGIDTDVDAPNYEESENDIPKVGIADGGIAERGIYGGGISRAVTTVLNGITAVATGNGLIIHIGNSPTAKKLSKELSSTKKFKTAVNTNTLQKIKTNQNYTAIDLNKKHYSKTFINAFDELFNENRATTPTSQKMTAAMDDFLNTSDKLEITQDKNGNLKGGLFMVPNDKNVLERAILAYDQILLDAQKLESATKNKGQLEFKK